MKTGLQVNLSTQLNLTLELQQAIRLLSLSTLELQDEIQILLQSNPFLENNDLSETTATDPDENTKAILFHEPQEKTETFPENENSFENNVSADPAAFSSSRMTDEIFYPEEPTLQEHLHLQMDLTRFSERERLLGFALIDAINEYGYMSATFNEIKQTVQPLLNDEIEIDDEEIETVLKRIQFFDPPGVAARDLRECLLLQIAQIDKHTPGHTLALDILQNHFAELSQHQLRKIQRDQKLDEKTLDTALKLIHALQPRPGNQINNTVVDSIRPDVMVKRIKDQWVVELNDENLPFLKLNTPYIRLFQKIEDAKQLTTVRAQIKEARWLVKSIETRHQTLLKVAKSIIQHQSNFLEQGLKALKPLTLSIIAQELGIHESTVSRITTQKYILTPQGVFELKYFFSNATGHIHGQEIAAKAIQEMIKNFIAAEDIRKPYSDDKITSLLKAKGYQVERRTVSKYREQLGILASHLRKQFFNPI